MERSDILELMARLKLFGMRAAYDEVMATAIKRQYEPARPYTELMESRFSQMTIYEPSTINKERLAALLAPEQPREPNSRTIGVMRSLSSAA